MKRLNESRGGLIAASACIFAVLLVCNFLTDLMGDDFAYFFSFRNGKRIASVLQIFPSMAAHNSSMNGRLVAHFLVQLFLMLPRLIFKVLNAGMFVAEILLMYRLSRNQQRNNLLFLMLFGAVWIFQPAFGQVNLWQDGSVNYLWCSTFNLLFLIPFAEKMLHDKDISSPWVQAAFVAFALLVGWYGENAALATILMVAVMLAVSLQKKLRIKPYMVAALVAFLFGFYMMMSSPATAKNKIASIVRLYTLLDNFRTALDMIYRNFKPIVIAICVLFPLAIQNKADKDRLILAGVLIFGAMCSNFAFIVASYYPERSAFYCAILLICACGVLFSEVWQTRYAQLCVSAGAVLLVFTVYFGIVGCSDIVQTHMTISQNTQVIAQCREQGIEQAELIIPTPETKYSAVWDSRYLHPTDPKEWPNNAMAKYYGLKGITGRYS